MNGNLRRTAMSIGLVLGAVAVLAGCVVQETRRMEMVRDPKTGILYGSTVEHNLVTDASFYNNRRIKIRTRNTSGDTAFGLKEFTSGLAEAYHAKGYRPTDADNFGLMIDVNVMHSGHIQTNMAGNFGFLGAATGALTGITVAADPGVGGAAGAVSGATLGEILGTAVTEDTYIIVAHVTFGVVKKNRKSRKRITFSRSKKIKNIDDPDEDEEVFRSGFKKTFSTHLAVYAGGWNVSQAQVVEEVKRRAIRIVGDFI